MKICVVIPARYKSSRFEGKPLADINGRPMLWWVYHSVLKSNRIDKVLVALDDERIASICENYNMNYLFTSETHLSSTERVHEVSELEKYDLYICVNGDEPLIDYKIIEAIIPNELSNEPFVSNLMTKINKPSEVLDNTNIKVVFNDNNEALYMSRSPIPFPKGVLDYDYFKHIGVLAYNKLALNFFKNTVKGNLERIEDVNELRFIENHISVKMLSVETNILSVDTPKDLVYVKDYLEKNNISYDDI